MPTTKKKYNLPKGYSLLEATLKTKEFLKNPVTFIAKSMAHFGSTEYTAILGYNSKVILTKNPNFISYVLKDNNRNYEKSDFVSGRARNFLGNGLVFNNGADWLKQRRLIQPAFHRQKLKGLYGIVIQTIKEFLKTVPTGEIDVFPLVNELSFKVLINSLFDLSFSPKIKEELSQLLIDIQAFLVKDVNQPFGRLLYPFTGTERAIVKKSARLRAILLEIINDRKASTKEYCDVLDMLLNSRYEDTGEPMSEDRLIDELLVLVFAGHETTGTSLSWQLYLLANNPAVKAKLLASFEDITVEDCLNNEYFKATINEGMRLYPAAWVTERIALTDDEFGDYFFPKGTLVVPFFYGLHRDENLWENATAFQPERFLKDGTLIRSKQFFPFGAGPRMCIGNHFALAEMHFFLYTFLKEFKLEATDQVPEMTPLLTLRPDKILLKVSRLEI